LFVRLGTLVLPSGVAAETSHLVDSAVDGLALVTRYTETMELPGTATLHWHLSGDTFDS
jgi:hypothetical protein